MLQAAQAQRARGRRCRRSASSKPTAARETEALLAGLEVDPAPAHRLQRPACSRRWTSTRILARRPAAGAGRRAGPHQRAGQPPSQALSGRRGTAGRRHRRLHHAQHPARRKPQRRGGADHPHPGARDRARQRARPRRRHRGGRPHARRPDPAPAARARSTSRDQAERARPPLFQARQPDRLARAGAAAHGAARRRADARPTCRPHAISGPWAAGERVLVCVSEAPDCAGLGALRQARWPTGCTRRGPRSMSRPRATSAWRRRSATASPTALRLAERLGGEAVTIPGGDIAEDVARPMPRPTTSPRS